MTSRTLSILLPAVILLAGMALFTSCKKEGCTDETATNYDPEADKDDGSCVYPTPDEVEFTVTSPAQGSTYGLGDTIHFDITITTSGEVHGYELKLRNTSMDDAVVFEKEDHAHESPVHIHDLWWVNNVEHHSDMELEITLVKNHDSDSEHHHVHFHCHPM